MRGGSLGRPERTALQSCLRPLVVVAIGPGHRKPDKDPRPIGREAAFRALLCPIRGIGGRFSTERALDMAPSMDGQVQWIPTSSSYRRRPRFPRWRKTPEGTQSWRRPYTVDFGPKQRGSAHHWILGTVRWWIPSMIFRSSPGGRPPLGRGGWVGRIAWIFLQSGSGRRKRGAKFASRRGRGRWEAAIGSRSHLYEKPSGVHSQSELVSGSALRNPPPLEE